jgi:hypothetical protein
MALRLDNCRAVTTRWITVLLIAVLSLCPAAELPTDGDARKVRGTFLGTLATSTEWAGRPKAAIPVMMKIGIFSKDKNLIVDLDDYKHDFGSWKGFKVIFPKTLEEARQCQILYVGKDEANEWAAKLKQLGNTNILTVSEAEGFLQQGGIVWFKLELVKQNAYGPVYAPKFQFHNVARTTNVFRISADFLKRQDTHRP